jgi:hypothetical protein
MSIHWKLVAAEYWSPQPTDGPIITFNATGLPNPQLLART